MIHPLHAQVSAGLLQVTLWELGLGELVQKKKKKNAGAMTTVTTKNYEKFSISDPGVSCLLLAFIKL